jgi:hypothetical protein
MKSEEYYAECVSIAADDCGAVLTKEQIDWIGGAIAGAVENFSMAFGYDVASTNLRASHDRAANEVKQRLRYEQEVHRTRCKTCQGHGFTRDGWGRDFGCGDCGGKGNTPDWPFVYEPSKTL